MPTSSRSRIGLRALVFVTLVTLVQLGCGRAGFVEPVRLFRKRHPSSSQVRRYMTELDKD